MLTTIEITVIIFLKIFLWICSAADILGLSVAHIKEKI